MFEINNGNNLLRLSDSTEFRPNSLGKAGGNQFQAPVWSFKNVTLFLAILKPTSPSVQSITPADPAIDNTETAQLGRLHNCWYNASSRSLIKVGLFINS